jgi:hypothetical protein
VDRAEQPLVAFLNPSIGVFDLGPQNIDITERDEVILHCRTFLGTIADSSNKHKKLPASLIGPFNSDVDFSYFLPGGNFGPLSEMQNINWIDYNESSAVPSTYFANRKTGKDSVNGILIYCQSI